MSVITLDVAIDRAVSDPGAPNDPARIWIGMVQVSWDGGLELRRAAIIKVATGRGTGDAKWGQYVLVLTWAGDQPPIEIAQAVYDWIRDAGPAPIAVKHQLEAQPITEAQPSYRPIRPMRAHA